MDSALKGLRIVFELLTSLAPRALNLRKKCYVGQAVVPPSREAMAGRLSSSSKAVISTPLAPEDLGRFIADALHGETERVIRRAQLVTDSTWQDREGEQSS